MDRQSWKRIAVVVGYVLSVALIVGGAAIGELAIVLAGLVLLAILLVSSNG